MAARVGVQAFVIGAGALVLGLVLGGLGPRSELRDTQQKLFDQQKKCASGAGGEAGAEFARLLTQGLAQRRAEKAAATPEATTDEPAPSVGMTQDADPTPVPSSDHVPDKVHDEPPVSDQLASAKEMLELRAHQARAALIEDADPTPDQLKVIDQAISDMNDQLVQSARTFADHAAADGQLSRRDVMSFGADALGQMVDAEDKMLGTLTPEQRAAVREDATDPTSFVDPQIVSIFQEIKGLDDKAAGP